MFRFGDAKPVQRERRPDSEAAEIDFQVKPDSEGKRHNQALIALARRRSDVLFAMLHNGTPYEDPAPKTAVSRLTKTIEGPRGSKPTGDPRRWKFAKRNVLEVMKLNHCAAGMKYLGCSETWG